MKKKSLLNPTQGGRVRLNMNYSLFKWKTQQFTKSSVFRRPFDLAFALRTGHYSC
jgi:hypothetical protein